MIAGINAALRAKGLEPWWPSRSEAYIGVLIDDLVTRGVSEPYRMFTSRAEYRLMLREDNADARLTGIGRKLGVVGDRRWEAFCRKREEIEKERRRLDAVRLGPSRISEEEAEKTLGFRLIRECTLTDLLKRPGVSYSTLSRLGSYGPWLEDADLARLIETEIKYEGYIARQMEEVARRREVDDLRLPPDADFAAIGGLSSEVRQILERHRPQTIGQASRLEGMTPAAVTLLLVYAKRGFPRRRNAA